MTEPRKTIVIISPAFPENEAATYWVPSQQLLVKAMKHHFPDYDFLVLAMLYPYQKKDYTWHDIPVVSFNGVAYGGIKRLLLWRKVWKRLKREKQIAGILSFWCKEAALVGSYFARWNKLPHYCWICGQDARSSNKYVKWIQPKASELVAISDFIAREFYKNHGIQPAHTIPNAIDPARFGKPVERDIDILGVGAFIPLKQFEVLIAVAQTIPHIRVKICGKGEERSRLLSLAKQSGAQIELIEAVTHEEVLQLMQRTRLLLHPSSYEGFSTVCLEALYAGAHVISFVQPMDTPIKNWHIATSQEDMRQKAVALLQSDLQHERVITWTFDDIAKRMMQLFQSNA